MSKIDGDSRRRVFRIVGDSEENAIYLLTLDADEMFWCSCNIIICDSETSRISIAIAKYKFRFYFIWHPVWRFSKIRLQMLRAT